jgi:8-hydroxy-5-deazaflavin:NADPH oxidoreductase
MPRTIAIIGGTGAEGFGLALRFARAGAPVRIGSRDLAKAQAAAQRIRDLLPNAAVESGLNADAVAGAEIAILTVPLAAQIPTLKSLRASFRPGAILVDATVPLEAAIGGSATRMLTLFAGSAAQQAARNVPEGVAVVAAFHSLGAELLADLDHPVDSEVLICGDKPEAKTAVAELVAMLPGARAVDAGPLENARLVEGLSTLLISLNIRRKAKHAGVRITGLLPGF